MNQNESKSVLNTIVAYKFVKKLNKNSFPIVINSFKSGLNKIQVQRLKSHILKISTYLMTLESNRNSRNTIRY